MAQTPPATPIETEMDRSTFDQLPEQPNVNAQLPDYMPGSRQQDVDEVLDWFETLAGSVFWIDGSAGQGKSTLMRYVGEQMRSQDRLAASVFLGGELSDEVGPDTVVKMLASELGKNHPRAIPKIVEAIEQCSGHSLKEYLQMFIVEPIRSLGCPHPLLIVVDALDEWDNYPVFIKELTHFTSQSSLVKFIITSRFNPRVDLPHELDNLSAKTRTLLPVPNDVVKDYLNQRLKGVEWPYGRAPTTKEVDQLAKQANGLLVWVSTVCSLLAGKFSEATPHEVLRDILALERKVGESEQLAELYRSAILRLFPTTDDQQSLRKHLGATIVLQESLPLEEFSSLIEMPHDIVKKVQTTLAALQIGSVEVETVMYPAAALFHLSFIEYVQNSDFATSTFDSHSTLGLTCLQAFLTSLPVLPQRLQSPEPLTAEFHSYTAKFWPFHVSNGTARSEEEWSRTPHSIALRETPIETLQQWAQLFLIVILPGWEESSMQFPTHNEASVLLSDLARTLGRNGRMVNWQVCCLEIAVRLAANDERLWSDLGECYDVMAKRTGNLGYFYEAVVVHRHALQLLPVIHPQRSSFLNNLACAVLSRFRRNGSHEDLDEAIPLYREALQLRPVTSPGRSQVLNNLAVALTSRFEQKGADDDLNEAISLHREGIELEQAFHGSNNSMSLNNLGSDLQRRFDRNGSPEDLEEAISLHREALRLAPASDPDLSMFLDNLATALLSLFELKGLAEDLDEAICFHREALQLHPAAHPDRSASLHNLAGALLSRSKTRGSDEDLNEAISLYREVLQFWSISHPNRPMSIHNLAVALLTRFKQKDADSDVEEAISLHREALRLRPTSHPGRPASLDSLANALLSRSGCAGEEGRPDLDEAISLYREALILRPEHHPDRFVALNNLGGTIWSRYEKTESEADLDEVVSLYRAALQLDERYYFPDRFNPLNNLAVVLLSRFELRGTNEDLDEAVELYRKTLRLCPASHPRRSMYLTNLAIGLFTRFQALDNDEDSEEGIAVLREALQHSADDFTRLRSFLKLIDALLKRFDKVGAQELLDEAVLVARDSLGVFTPEHYYRKTLVKLLCERLKGRVEIGENQDYHEEISRLEAELESESEE
ncbi:hypothetical protein EST38_g4346 [Candolleomyces aberdarensis]|uniref:Nephrocystin 3-like N-terminal domain-containing protein n=1 Tax=Candolleomyces aberdarensis TaxID=2316362 RepID=A0A4Q2DMT0_9AGAR|nr:hypothetical protein EST38_g4346 [Candolleomyces aberdarensis]